MRRGTEIPDGERAVFHVGPEEVTVVVIDGEMRIYADGVLNITPWATNTIRIQITDYHKTGGKA